MAGCGVSAVRWRASGCSSTSATTPADSLSDHPARDPVPLLDPFRPGCRLVCVSRCGCRVNEPPEYLELVDKIRQVEFLLRHVPRRDKAVIRHLFKARDRLTAQAHACLVANPG